MITFTQFTTDYPEFASASQGKFNLYLNLSSLMLTSAWGQPAAAGQPATQYDFGTELFIAHNIAIDMLNTMAAAAGGVPGLNRGVISSEAGGAVNIGYDTNAGIEPDAGHWNLTTYGLRFIQMLRLIGAGPTQVSPAGNCIPYNGPAWTGPWPYPGYFG